MKEQIHEVVISSNTGDIQHIYMYTVPRVELWHMKILYKHFFNKTKAMIPEILSRWVLCFLKVSTYSLYDGWAILDESHKWALGFWGQKKILLKG